MFQPAYISNSPIGFDAPKSPVPAASVLDPERSAEAVRASTPTVRKRVAMVTHSFYESDGRVTRYAEALASRGDTVEVFALKRDRTALAREVRSGVTVYRIQSRSAQERQSSIAYLFPLLRFLLSSSWHLSHRHFRQRYDVVHVHNIPDFLVFAAWLPRLMGAAVILDIHDIVPELYGSKFATGREGAVIRVLKWVERQSAHFAHHVIISNHLWWQKFSARTKTSDKCSVFINNVDTRIFRPGLRTRQDGRLIAIFPGGLQWHQGVDLAVRAFQLVSAALPTAELHIYGNGKMKPSLLALTQELALTEKVKFFPPVPLAEIVPLMANADVGVVPKRADTFGNEAYSTKIMEFMSLGVPVVVSRTRIDEYYFNDSVVHFFSSGDITSLAEALLAVLRDSRRKQELVGAGLKYAQTHGWDSRKPDYLRLVDSLCATAVSAP